MTPDLWSKFDEVVFSSKCFLSILCFYLLAIRNAVCIHFKVLLLFESIFFCPGKSDRGISRTLRIVPFWRSSAWSSWVFLKIRTIRLCFDQSPPDLLPKRVYRACSRISIRNSYLPCFVVLVIQHSYLCSRACGRTLWTWWGFHDRRFRFEGEQLTVEETKQTYSKNIRTIVQRRAFKTRLFEQPAFWALQLKSSLESNFSFFFFCRWRSVRFVWSGLQWNVE